MGLNPVSMVLGAVAGSVPLIGVAKDMHHLAMAIPLLLLCFALLPGRIAVLTSIVDCW